MSFVALEISVDAVVASTELNGILVMRGGGVEPCSRFSMEKIVLHFVAHCSFLLLDAESNCEWLLTS